MPESVSDSHGNPPCLGEKSGSGRKCSHDFAPFMVEFLTCVFVPENLPPLPGGRSRELRRMP
jgi:hypothetical protein